MKISSFNFKLPKNLITQYPKERENAKLMVVDKEKKTITHKKFSEIIDYFSEGDVLVMNDTKLFPAKLKGIKERGENKIEVVLLREVNKHIHLWDVKIAPAKKIRLGNKITFGKNDLIAEVIDNTTSRGRIIKFLYDSDSDALHKIINYLGVMNLPERIHRETLKVDENRLQTVYAKNRGTIFPAAAGLNFTEFTIKKLLFKGVKIAPITLHLNTEPGLQIDLEDYTKYKICSSYMEVTKETAELINQASSQKKKIFIVGGDTGRALESTVSTTGSVLPKKDWTNKFIYPEYNPKLKVNYLTNFQLPSSLNLLVDTSYIGYNMLMKAYEEAIKKKYSFFVYGDSLLVI